MDIIAADDEELMLETLTDAITEAVPDAVIHGFRKASAVLEFAEHHPCEIAFLDIQMRGMNGLELAKKLKEFHPKVNIIFVTGCEQYTGDAMRLHASGYITKPVTKEKIEEEMDDLRHPVVLEPKHRIRVQCFGSFEVFADGSAMPFRYNKTLELFAYLVDRKGALVSAGELMAILWEDKTDSMSLRSQLRNLISDLSAGLRQVDSEEVLIKARRNYAVNCSAVDCDYFDFLNKGINAINRYTGEYMIQYSWAEMTIGSLEMQSQ